MAAEKKPSDDIKYMQTVGDNATGEEKNKERTSQPLSAMIDPPRKKASQRNASFESDDDILTTDDDDGDYLLSTASSSDESQTLNPQPRSAKRNDVPGSAGTSQSTVKSSTVTSQPNPAKSSPTAAKESANPPRGTRSLFMDTLNEILEEKMEVPEKSNIGPKPWLMRNRRMKASEKYRVSQEPLVFKPKTQTTKVAPSASKTQNQNSIGNPGPSKIASSLSQVSNSNAPSSEKSVSNLEDLYAVPRQRPKPTLPQEDIYAKPTPRGKELSASTSLTVGDNERYTKNSSDADTGFESMTSSYPSSSNASSNASRLPSREEKTNSAGDAKSAQELAKAAIQALSLSKNILQDMGKGKEVTQTTTRASDYIYDEVPNSPSEKTNMYDDVAVSNGDRKVISVPVFKPPPDPVRNDRNHPMSSEPLYDITRSNVQTPTNVSSSALELMYQMFGKDLAGPNALYAQPGRPKSVTFEDELRSQGDIYSSRPSSRAGSISEWSDCTLNLPEYPESDASTLPRTTVNFPQFPLVGVPPRQPSQLNFPRPQTNFTPNANPRPQQQFSQQNFPPFPQQQFPPPQGSFNTPNNVYGAPRNPAIPFPHGPFPANTPQHYGAPRNPMASGPQGVYPPHNPAMLGQEAPGPKHPIYGSFNPHQSFAPMGQQYPGPSRPQFSPRMSQWEHFPPPRIRHPSHHHGRGSDRSGRHRRRRSHSRKREPSYSDEEDFSRSPSPLRHHQRRDVIDRDFISGKSYIDGYKAALKDAVLTFAENQNRKRITNQDKVDPEERMHRNLRRVLSAGRIHELPDNVELGDIRKAFSSKKSYSDDDCDDVLNDVMADAEFLIPSTGRPFSRSGSLRSIPRDDRRRKHRRGRYRRNDDIIDSYSSESDHGESCDCSECEEYYEMRVRFHEGESMTPRLQRSNDVTNQRRDEMDNGPATSAKMKGLRQRYIESMEATTGNVRASVRAHSTHPQDGGIEFDSRMHPRDGDRELEFRNRRIAERRRENFEDVRPYGSYNPYGTGVQHYGVANAAPPIYHQPRPPMNDWQRPKRVQFGYQ